MISLSKGQKLKITRIGKGLTLRDVAKMTFLSISYISRMESDDRGVPPDVERILDTDNGIRWYETIVEALSGESTLENDAKEALKILNHIILDI